MQFDINNYLGKFVMHCKTEEEAKDFIEYMKKFCKPYQVTLRPWCMCGDNVYYFKNDTWSNKEYAINTGYRILEWSDFMNKTFTKADLKTGDVILRRNGQTEIINHELKMCITKNGWNDLDDVHTDLTSKLNQEWDVIAVRRPKKKFDCRFDAFERNCGTLVYERKEVEEMTLEQVCKLLGKEIKIIK